MYLFIQDWAFNLKSVINSADPEIILRDYQIVTI